MTTTDALGRSPDDLAEVPTLSTADLWELRADYQDTQAVDGADEQAVRDAIEAELIERLNGKPDPTVEPEEPRDLSVVRLPDGTVLTENPLTGEALDLEVATVDELFALQKNIDEHLTRVYALKQAAVDHVADRVDRMGSGRTAFVDGHKIKVNAPQSTSWNMAVVQRNLELLIEKGVLPRAVLDNIIVTPEQPPRPPQPPTPPPYVDKTRAKMLAQHPDQRVRAALEQAATTTRAPRKIVEHVPPEDGSVVTG